MLEQVKNDLYEKMMRGCGSDEHERQFALRAVEEKLALARKKVARAKKIVDAARE